MIIYVLTFYLFDGVKKISESLCYVKGNFDNKCTCSPNLNIFYLRFTLGIIHDNCFVGKTPKIIILFKLNYFFWPLNLVTELLFEEILVLTSF